MPAWFVVLRCVETLLLHQKISSDDRTARTTDVACVCNIMVRSTVKANTAERRGVQGTNPCPSLLWLCGLFVKDTPPLARPSSPPDDSVLGEDDLCVRELEAFFEAHWDNLKGVRGRFFDYDVWDCHTKAIALERS